MFHQIFTSDFLVTKGIRLIE